MDTLTDYRRIIREVLTEYARAPYAHGEIQIETVFDVERDHYLLVLVGWDGERGRIHGSLVHVDLIDGKFWIQRDGTEYGIARELEDAGVPRGQIVLGFREPRIRPHTGYAVA